MSNFCTFQIRLRFVSGDLMTKPIIFFIKTASTPCVGFDTNLIKLAVSTTFFNVINFKISSKCDRFRCLFDFFLKISVQKLYNWKVGGVELELIAIASGGRICPRFEELSEDKLGSCARMVEMNVGTSDTSHRSMLFVEGCPNSKAITVLFRGGNKMICEEAQRSLHDAMCVVRNLLRDSYVCPGGGASEIAASIAVSAEADNHPGLEQYVIRAYSDALDVVPVALAESVGLPALSTIADLKVSEKL